MYCAIDFGTSNSAIAIPDPGVPGRMQLVELEPGYRTMPTAVFYPADAGGGIGLLAKSGSITLACGAGTYGVSVAESGGVTLGTTCGAGPP